MALPILILTVFVWRALVDAEERQLDRMVATDLARIESVTSLRISTRVQTLDRMAERWQFSGRPAEQDWEHGATLVLRDYDGFQSVEWVSATYDQYWGVTSEAGGTLVGDDIQDQETLRTTADLARATGVSVASPIVDLPESGRGVVLFVPIFMDGAFDGFVLGSFLIDDLFGVVLDQSILPNYTVAVETDGGEVFRAESRNPTGDDALKDVEHFQIAGTSWSLRVWPDQAVIERADTRLPEVIFAGGIVGALLLALAVHLAEQARRRERKARAAELALQESERRFRALAEQGYDVVVILTPERGVKYISPSVNRLLGYTGDEVLHTISDGYAHPDDLPGIIASFEAVLGVSGMTGEPIAFRLHHADGSWRYFEAVLTNCVHDPAIRGIVGNLRDITERKRSEQSLREAEERFRTLVEQLPVIAYISTGADIDVVTYASPQIEQVTGFTQQEWLGNGEAWINRVHMDDQDRVLADSAEKNRTGMTGSIEYRVITRDGRTIWVRDEAVLVTNSNGRPLFWQGFIIDITRRKLAEQEAEAFTAALERSNRELQEFAYVASHDLRAPLVSLRGMASILHEDYAAVLDDEGRLYLDRIIANGDRMQELLEELLEISRVGKTETDVTEVDLNAVVDTVVQQQTQAIAGRGGRVTIEGELPLVVANRTRMVQVFSNLIDNALRYTPPDRAPAITVGGRARRDVWELYVSDNGVGIPDEYRDKVYGMFQRLPDGKQLNPQGTGMGLAIVGRIIEWYGGKIWAEPNDDRGTTFRFTIARQTDHDLTSSDASSLAETTRLILNR